MGKAERTSPGAFRILDYLKSLEQGGLIEGFSCWITEVFLNEQSRVLGSFSVAIWKDCEWMHSKVSSVCSSHNEF